MMVIKYQFIFFKVFVTAYFYVFFKYFLKTRKIRYWSIRFLIEPVFTCLEDWENLTTFMVSGNNPAAIDLLIAMVINGAKALGFA